MTERMQVYKCGICGNIVEVMHSGPGELVCCGKPMTLLQELTADAATEKHVPVIEKTANGYKVKVGSVPHPMIDAHFIEWIELSADGAVFRKYLKPGEPAEAFFAVSAGKVSAREYCSVHSLWKA
jgi:superoxide reductase